MEKSPDSFSDTFDTLGTLVSPCAGVPTLKTFPPPRSTADTSRLAFVRGVSMGIAMTSLALLGVVVVVSAPASWRGVSEVRPVAMRLVEHISARRADVPRTAKAPPASTESPEGKPTTPHRERLVSERRQELQPSKKIFDRALGNQSVTHLPLKQ